MEKIVKIRRKFEIIYIIFVFYTEFFLEKYERVDRITSQILKPHDKIMAQIKSHGKFDIFF